MPLSNERIRQLIKSGELTGVAEEDILYASVLLRAGHVMRDKRRFDFTPNPKIPIIEVFPYTSIIVVTDQHIHLADRYIGYIVPVHQYAEVNVDVRGAPIMGGFDGQITLQFATHEIGVAIAYRAVVAQLLIDEVDGAISYIPPRVPLRVLSKVVANMRIDADPNATEDEMF